MTDPFKSMLEMQRAMLDGWMASTSQMMKYWQHMLELQEQLITQATIVARTHVEIDDGPSFTGKYGKRRFDIDPERDV
ncbi:hypothetical protein [Magnetospirillum sp. SS-4]|uniref:hypothetical protein n=1 Tax=Magnetospirillum sp. SS-4 TaxID=2681465 RepID=UPI00137F2FF0|nr:hypothetical protein [Magnetospirillum sp. SS-4]CAA7620792.1 conserved hypothetical protein [Magnetospirillum sp. SS-4]